MSSWWQVLIPCFFVLSVVSSSASELTTKNDTDCSGVPLGQIPQYKGNASIILDEVLTATSNYLREINITQMDIPDQRSEFTFFFVAGTLFLTEGKISGFDKMKRFGSAAVEYFDKGTTSSAAVKFADASIFYKIEVHISSSIFKGRITASLEQLTMRLNVSLNMTNLCKNVDSVVVENLNSIKVNSDMDGWIPNSLANTLVNTVTWIYKNRIIPFIEYRTARAVQSVLDSINLDELLRPPKDSPV